MGSCKRCGECCKFSNTDLRLLSSLLGTGDVLYMLHPFLEGLKDGEKCPHSKLRGGKGFCKIYNKRPKWCRDFPTSPYDIISIPNCGYYFVDESGYRVDFP